MRMRRGTRTARVLRYSMCPPTEGATGFVPQSEAMGEGTRLRALPDLSPRAKRWGKGPACGHYRICPPERSDGGRDPLAGTTGSVPQSEAMGEGTRLRALPDLSPRAKRWGKGPACGHYRICPPERSDGGRDPLAGTTGSVPQSEAMGEGTRLRVGGHQTRARPTSGVPTPSPAPPVLTGSVPQSEAMG